MHRNNADWIVDVCLNCHAELTERQLTWSTQQSSSRELGLKDMQEIGERRRKWRERNKLTYRA
ncbi:MULTISPECIES: hypothetical protein [Nitrosomonas]|nr:MULTISPECIES: hypothetical protein [Nitrosomonas]UVS60205.1 hypothetical protein NX761_11840 [Nitrosomonas sp. PLL12]